MVVNLIIRNNYFYCFVLLTLLVCNCFVLLTLLVCNRIEYVINYHSRKTKTQDASVKSNSYKYGFYLCNPEEEVNLTTKETLF